MHGRQRQSQLDEWVVEERDTDLEAVRHPEHIRIPQELMLEVVRDLQPGVRVRGERWRSFVGRPERKPAGIEKRGRAAGREEPPDREIWPEYRMLPQELELLEPVPPRQSSHAPDQAEHGRHPGNPSKSSQPRRAGEARIPAEQLVSTDPGERDRQARLARRPGDEPRVETVDRGLVHRVEESFEPGDEIPDPQPDLDVLRSVSARGRRRRIAF
jgi:hypothetical protein